MPCSINLAQYALVGRDRRKDMAGVLNWYSNQLEAYRDLRKLRYTGGEGRVVPAPGGALNPRDYDEVANLMVEQWSE